MASGLSALNPKSIGQQSRIGDLVLDALVREEEHLMNRVTEFPAEEGFAFSDHVVREPRRLTFVGFVTNSPVMSHGGPIGQQARGSTIPILDRVVGTNLNFADLALKYLYQIRDAGQLLIVTTPRGIFSNLQLEQVSRIKVKETGDALEFTIIFRETRTVALQMVAVPTKRTESGRAQPVQEVGKKTPAAVPPAQEESILHKGVSAAGGAIHSFFGGSP